MGRRRKRSGSGDPLDKAVGRLAETTGMMSGDKNLEAEGRATQRMGERKTYVVTTHADGGWKVQVEGASRATSVHKTKERQWPTPRNWRGATSRASSSSTSRTGLSRRSKPTGSVFALVRGRANQAVRAGPSKGCLDPVGTWCG